MPAERIRREVPLGGGHAPSGVVGGTPIAVIMENPKQKWMIKGYLHL